MGNKMKSRKIIFGVTVLSAIICVIILVFLLVFPILLSFKLRIDYSDVSAIGIIGAADGITSITVADSTTSILFAATPMIITIGGSIYLFLTKKSKK